jgi:hypothetical protein
VRLEGLGQLKISNDLIGNQTCNLPACSIVSQQTKLPRAPFNTYIHLYITNELQTVTPHYNKTLILQNIDFKLIAISSIYDIIHNCNELLN